MRAYFFGNMYLSSIQQGIQAAHVVAEMFRIEDDGDDEGPRKILHEWADDHQTMVLLNAGYSEEIRKLAELFNMGDNPYPWATFAESEEALDNALTCIGIILPVKIYETARMLRTASPQYKKLMLDEMKQW